MRLKGLTAILAASACLMAVPTWAQEVKTSMPVALIEGDQTVDVEWKFLTKDQITKNWNICVLFPHLKDSYWVAANYGVADQIKNAGVSMTLYEAGGYSNLSTQLSQLDNCIAQGADGIILGAISADGVGALVQKATSAGIPVIDFVTGINDPSTSGHSSVSYYTMANLIGKYLVDKGVPLNVGYFPGPQGAGWSDDAVRGFEDAIAGSSVKIVDTRRGDTGVNTQLDLITNALTTYDNLDYIVGVGTAAEAGAVAVRNAGLAGKVKVAAFNTSPQVQTYIKSGEVEAAPTDFPPLQGRLAVDMVLRMLEKQELPGTRGGPKPEMITAANVDTLEFTDTYSPEGYSVVFSLNEGK